MEPGYAAEATGLRNGLHGQVASGHITRGGADGTLDPDHIVETKGKGPTEKFQLYHLSTDPGETTNLFAKEQTKAKELFEALKADIARGRSRP